MHVHYCDILYYRIPARTHTHIYIQYIYIYIYMRERERENIEYMYVCNKCIFLYLMLKKQPAHIRYITNLQEAHLSVSDTNTLLNSLFHCYGWEGAEGRRWTGMCTVHTSLWPLEYIGSLSHRGFDSLVRYFILTSVKQAAVSSSLISSPGTSSEQHHVSPTSTRPEHMINKQTHFSST